ncbi:MAG: hypothetical protein WDA09_10310 [Bacteriovoracaceae bacterium]|jgi:hypothetical protein
MLLSVSRDRGVDLKIYPNIFIESSINALRRWHAQNYPINFPVNVDIRGVYVKIVYTSTGRINVLPIMGGGVV